MADIVQIDWGAGRTGTIPVTLAGGTTVSGNIDLMGKVIRGVISPSGGFAGAIKFNAASSLNGTYYPVKTSGGADLTLTAVANAFSGADPATFELMKALRYVQLTYADPGTDKAVTLVTTGAI